MVIDNVNDLADVPQASNYAIIKLSNVHIGDRAGDLALEHRSIHLGFINSPEGARASVQYTVIEGTGDFKDAKGGGSGALISSQANRSPIIFATIFSASSLRSRSRR